MKVEYKATLEDCEIKPLKEIANIQCANIPCSICPLKGDGGTRDCIAARIRDTLDNQQIEY